MSTDHIRNFSIIAHIDHGKSTLADRFLEATGAIQQREMQAQFLDRLDLERERGITIKAQTVRLSYKAQDGKTYQLNLIDTPGHVDFHYEVSRSLAACEGALLVVDASQGVEAQTLANVYVALENDLEIVPVLNKIDLQSADVDGVKREIESIIGLDTSQAVAVSAKTGFGVAALLEAVVQRVPPPRRGSSQKPLRALVYDSWFDSYLGVVVQVRIVDGALRKGDKVRFMRAGADYEVYRVGVYSPHPTDLDALYEGEVGYFAASIKRLRDVKIGDTVTLMAEPAAEPLPGFRDTKAVVFGGLYPVESDDYANLRVALDKLALNDSSFVYDPESSVALGFGFRCGFLGLLHMEVVQERLEREFELDLITTAPSVVYKAVMESGEERFVENPSLMPEGHALKAIEEPYVTMTIHCPRDYVGAVLKLCEDKRGEQKGLQFHGNNRAMIVYEMPLAEILLDFHDKLKSKTRGYGSFDYEILGYRRSDLVKLDIRLNGETVDALSIIVHKDNSYYRGRDLVNKLKELIERQQFEVAIQAVIGNRPIARATVKPLRKNVTAKCYGGDITRKRKLLEKQKKGKRRMKQVGRVEISQEAFLAVLKLGED